MPVNSRPLNPPKLAPEVETPVTVVKTTDGSVFTGLTSGFIAGRSYLYTANFGKGRVFYSTLGHTQESWSDPDIRKMYLEAVKWALRITDYSPKPHPKAK